MDLVSFLLDKYPEVKVPGQMVTLCLTTRRTAKTLSEEDSHCHRQSVRVQFSFSPALSVSEDARF